MAAPTRNPVSFLTTTPARANLLVIFNIAQPQLVPTLAAGLRDRTSALYSLPLLGQRLGSTLQLAQPVGDAEPWTNKWEVVHLPPPASGSWPSWEWLLMVGGGLFLLCCVSVCGFACCRCMHKQEEAASAPLLTPIESSAAQDSFASYLPTDNPTTA